MGNLRTKTQGLKVHGVQVTAILIALSSYFFGPFDVGSMHFDAITTKELIATVWAALTASFFSAKFNRQAQGK